MVCWGGVLWGDGIPARITLGRSDIWDLRPSEEFASEEYNFSNLKKWIKNSDVKKIHEIFENPYTMNGSCRIPIGRIVIHTGSSLCASSCLNIQNGKAMMTFGNGVEISTYLHSVEPFGVINVRNTSDVHVDIQSPYLNHDGDSSLCRKLGYPKGEKQSTSHSQSYIQPYWNGVFFVFIKWKRNAEGWSALWTVQKDSSISSSIDGVCNEILNSRWADFEKSHNEWWEQFLAT